MTRRDVAFAMVGALAVGACSSDDVSDGTAPASTSSAETVVYTFPPTDSTVPSTTAPPVSAPPTDAPTTTRPEEAAVTVSVPEYPLFDNDLVVPDQAALDAHAAAYLASVASGGADMERFLFGSLPVTVFDRLFSDEAVPSGDELGGLMWMMHLSGYFGGRWLRGELVAAQPEALIAGVSIPPSAEGFAATVARAQIGVDAASGGEAEALAYARASLLDEPAPAGGGDPVPGLTDSFGYNLGYLLEILDTPPAGLSSGSEFQVTCKGLFGCRYATPRLAVLAHLAEVQSNLAIGDGAYGDLVTDLMPLQQAAEPRGRSVWSSGLSVQGFSQRSYDQLLDVSSSFLETVQATALTMVQAIVEGNADQARRGALANAAMVIWLAAYRDGLLDGESPTELPTFE